MSGGGGTSSNTQTTSVQIPAYEQGFSQSIQNQAASLAQQPFPVYQGQLQAALTPQEQQSFQQVSNSANAQAPYNAAASASLTNAQKNLGAAGTYETAAQPYQTQDAAMQAQDAQYQATGANELNYANTLNPGNQAALQQYMSPYVNMALQPQMLQAQQNLANQQLQTNAQATSAGAFGDARQGVQNSLNNYYGDQTMAGIQANGYNTAFNNALSSLNQQQQNVIGIGQGYGTIGNNVGTAGNNTGQAGMNMAAIGNNIANQAMDMGTIGTQQATLGQMVQGEGLQGANALYDSGQIQQNQTQQALNMEYQQYQNQVQWPYQMMNVQESALSNAPYNIQTQITLPQANQTASGLGSFLNTAGGLGSLLSGGGGSQNTAPFGSPQNG